MWLAQWPDGTWMLFKGKPQEKMGGWDGHQIAILTRGLYTISWRGTLRQVDPEDYGYDVDWERAYEEHS